MLALSIRIFFLLYYYLLPGKSLPVDPRHHKLINDVTIDGQLFRGWDYYFRENGMQTSTDDVLLSWVALKYHLQDNADRRNWVFTELYSSSSTCEFQYMDMGCGIGSILFLVTHGLITSQMKAKILTLDPKTIVARGVEVQRESADMAAKSAADIEDCSIFRHSITVDNADIRELVEDSQHIKYDLMTANPPYFPTTLGTFCSDSQRQIARFEVHGGIEEYCAVARALLAPSGRFVCSFPSSGGGEARARNAIASAGLRLIGTTSILMGRPDAIDPAMYIFEAELGNGGGIGTVPLLETTVDIRRVAGSNRLNPRYYAIQADLNMGKRPLKKSSKS